MNPLLRLTACLLVILVFSAAAAMAWDRGDQANATPPSAQTAAADSSNSR